MMKLSDYVVSFFESQHVKHVFMVAGGGCIHLVDSFGSSPQIEYVCMHHEQGAAMAAEGYAKQKNSLGLVLVTSGPGATNAITGVLGAYQDSAPVVFLSGQAKREQTTFTAALPGLRQFGVQEANIIPVVESITKYSHFVDNPADIRYVLEKAVTEATSGRPGPVWIDIPLDVQGAQIDEENLRPYPLFENVAQPTPDETMVSKVLQDLCKAKRPVVIAGQGVRLANAIAELESLAARLDIPVVTPIMGIDLLHEEHPQAIGRVGTKGTRAGNFAMQNADYILAVGTRLAVSVVGHDYASFAREAKVAVVDIDPVEHQKKTIRIDDFIQADARAFLTALLQRPALQEATPHTAWSDFCREQKRRYPVCLPAYDDDAQGINYYKFVDAMSRAAPPHAPIVSDAGSAFYAVSQAVRLKKGQRYITSGALATMGFSLPAAIGVSFAVGKGMTVAVTGDGSMNQNPQELAVMAHNKLPIKLFVTNNNGYLSIRQSQRRYFDGRMVGESASSGLSFPDLSLLAQAYGVEYARIRSIEEMEQKLPSIFASAEPMLIEVILTPNQEIIPTNSSAMRADGSMVSKPLEDMYPFLSREEFLANMSIPPVEE
jgi:acetolactate synthase-1/2/3 large subunit